MIWSPGDGRKAKYWAEKKKVHRRQKRPWKKLLESLQAYSKLVNIPSQFQSPRNKVINNGLIFLLRSRPRLSSFLFLAPEQTSIL
ncbi:unnamed protein product [Clonostachys byssicola]|uniref:Uncharacterized protein n=1 Tax=Clonostachys byssicola TaxID=160290 RepID=A0A9N9UHA0_9HYPO|nr:unnamed protein product [Clonostachys byssicola]